MHNIAVRDIIYINMLLIQSSIVSRCRPIVAFNELCLILSLCSVKNTTFIGRDHILDIDESVFSTVDLEHLKSLLNEVTKVGGLALTVVDLVAEVLIADLEDVEHREDLSVVGDKGLTNGV